MKSSRVKCPNSPTGHHITHVDSRNHETCIHCGFQRQNPIEDLAPVYFFDQHHINARQRDTVMMIYAQRSALVRDYG